MSLRNQFGKDILLTGWGHSKFGKLTEDTLESLIVQVASEAITTAGIVGIQARLRCGQRSPASFRRHCLVHGSTQSGYIIT